MPSLRLETLVPGTAQAAFDLSLSVDAHTASMHGSGEQAVAGVTSGRMALGESVTWRARHFGLPFTMTSRITELDEPNRFVDEQVSGPFERWRHEHLFTETADGTVMVDVVDYASPLGPLGSLVDRLVLARYTERLLKQRNTWLAEKLTHG